MLKTHPPQTAAAVLVAVVDTAFILVLEQKDFTL